MVNDAILPFGEAFPDYSISERIPDEREEVELYHATDAAGRRVRLVCCAPDPRFADVPDEVKFARRLDRLRSIHHPSQLEILDGGVRGRVRWVAHEDIPEGTNTLAELLDFIPSGHLLTGSVLEVLISIASLLAVATKVRVYHGDLCPELIALQAGEDELPRLLELGFRQLFGETADRLPLYRAPEQIAGGRPDHRSDMYALGMITYRAVAGRHPFSDARGALPDPGRLGLMHLEKTPPTLKSKTSVVSQGVSDLVARLIAKEPGERFQSWQAVLNAAEEAREGFLRWRDLLEDLGALGMANNREMKRLITAAPFTNADSGHRYTGRFTEGMNELGTRSSTSPPSSEPDSEEVTGCDAVVKEALRIARAAEDPASRDRAAPKKPVIVNAPAADAHVRDALVVGAPVVDAPAPGMALPTLPAPSVHGPAQGEGAAADGPESALGAEPKAPDTIPTGAPAFAAPPTTDPPHVTGRWTAKGSAPVAVKEPSPIERPRRRQQKPWALLLLCVAAFLIALIDRQSATTRPTMAVGPMLPSADLLRPRSLAEACEPAQAQNPVPEAERAPMARTKSVPRPASTGLPLLKTLDP